HRVSIGASGGAACRRCLDKHTLWASKTEGSPQCRWRAVPERRAGGVRQPSCRWWGAHVRARGACLVDLLLSLACGLVVTWPRAGASDGAPWAQSGAAHVGASRSSSRRSQYQSRVDVMQIVLVVLARVHVTACSAQQKFRWVSLSVISLLGS